MSRRRRHAGLLALALCAATAAAGCPGSGAKKHGGSVDDLSAWRSFTDTHKLTSVLVTATHAWAGSDRGLLRWDLLTSEVTILSEDDGLASQPVRALAAEPGGAIWVAGDKGMSRIDGGRITNFVGDAWPVTGTVRALAITTVGHDPLHGWLSTDAGLYRMAYGAWNLFTSEYKINDIAAGLAGELWIATADRGIVRLRADGATTVGAAEGLPGLTVTALRVGADGQAVALCADAPGKPATAVAIFDGHGWRGFKPDGAFTLDLLARPEERTVVRAGGVFYEIVAVRSDDPKLPPDDPSSVHLALVSGAADADSTTKDGYRLRRVGPPPGGARPSALALDHGGDLYIGTHNLGLARLPIGGGPPLWLRTSDLLTGAKVLSLATDAAGKVYLPTRGRTVMVFDGSSWTESVVDAVIDDPSGAVWAIHRSGGTNILKFSKLRADGGWDPVGDVTIALPRGELVVGYVAVTPAGRFWISVAYKSGADTLPFGMAVVPPTLDGVSYYRRYDKPPEDASLSLPVNDISAVTFDAGGAWMATFSGVYRLAKDKSTLYTENEGLVSEITYDVVRTRLGDTWVATGAGIGKLKGDTWRFDSAGGGIPRKAFRALAVTDRGELWAGGAAGAYHRDSDEWIRLDPKKTGLLDGDVLDIVVDRRGRLWFLTATGLSLYEEK